MSEEITKKRFIVSEGDETAGLKLYERWKALEAEWLEKRWLESSSEWRELENLRKIAQDSSLDEPPTAEPKKRGRPSGTPKTQAERDAKRADSRGRNWTIVLYPDDLPEDWLDKVRDIKCKLVLSPLHDKDENADGTPKKPHYHALLMFGGIKSLNAVRGLFVSLFGENDNGAIPGVATIAKNCIVHDTGAMVRYLVHMDNPEKHQYSVDDMQAFNGADLMELLRRSMSETQSIMVEMEKYIEDNEITELCDFARAIRETKPDWYMILTTKSTVYFNAFIRSRRHKLKGEAWEDPKDKLERDKALEALGYQFDEKTGEVTEVEQAD